eukprot:2623232-Prorocentrum_lima.AAC.1
MKQFRMGERQGAGSAPFWDEVESSTPRGTPVQTGKEHGFEKHSCLYEAVAKYLGMREGDNPVSTLRCQCVEYLRAHYADAWLRWDEVDGYGRITPWEKYLTSIQHTDAPAGLYELEALMYRLQLQAV